MNAVASTPAATPLGSAYLAGRERELASLADAMREGELTIISAADPALAAALADGCAEDLLRRGWSVARTDARLADDITDLARGLARAAAEMLTAGPLVTDEAAFETAAEGRARLAARRVLGESAYALATGAGKAPSGVSAITTAAEAVVAAREESGDALLVLHGVDELTREGLSRFKQGPEALWALRGVWQRSHGAALLTGGPAAAAMSTDEEHGFYGYGHLHEASDLPTDQLLSVYRDFLGPRADEAAVTEARELLGHGVWMAADLSRLLRTRGTINAHDVRAAWQTLVRSREPELHGLLRAAERVHRFAVPVLKAVARAERPYTRLRQQGLRSSDVARALVALETHSLTHRLGDAQWRVADPAVAELLRTAR